MNFSEKDFLTPKQILADVLRYTDEEGYKNVTEGHCISLLQRCMEELSYRTYFNEKHSIIDITDKSYFSIPKGMFNLKQMYVFNGEECRIGENTATVWHKNNFFSKGSGYFARDKGNLNAGDPFYSRERTSGLDYYDRSSTSGVRGPDGKSSHTSLNRLLFYNISEGIVMLSDACRNYSKVFMQYSGVSTAIGDTPYIPNRFRQAVIDWMCHEIWTIKSAKSQSAQAVNHAMAMRNDFQAKLNGRRPGEGSWYEATRRAKVLDNKHREDLKVYLTRLDY